MANRILFLDNIKARVEHLIKALEDVGFEVLFSNQYQGLMPMAAEYKPDLVILNLIIEGRSAFPIIRELKETLKGIDTKIIVATSQKSIENIRAGIKAGASDFLIEPIDPKVLVDRVRYQLQDRDIFDIEKIKDDPDANQTQSFYFLYDTLRILSETKNAQNALHHCLKRVGDESGSPRVNILVGDLETGEAAVIASSDDPNVFNINVNLDRYNEVREVLLNGGIIYIKDINQNPLTKDIKDLAKTVDIQSLLVFPIRHRAQTIGTMNIRLSQGANNITDGHLKTYYMVAQLIGSKVAARKLVKQNASAPA